jgi:hypothetical protein
MAGNMAGTVAFSTYSIVVAARSRVPVFALPWHRPTVFLFCFLHCLGIARQKLSI